jgi:hypothetical protein
MHMVIRVHRSAAIALFLLGLAAAGVVACGGGEGDASETAVTDERESTSGGEAGGESMLIKTNVKINIPEGGPVSGTTISKGEVLGGSSIADTPLCPGGTFRDQHGDDPAIGLVLRTFDCPDGSLRIGITPGPPTTPRTQAGPWRVLSGTGAFEGLQGDGQVEITYEPGTRATEGRETFTGTVSQ